MTCVDGPLCTGCPQECIGEKFVRPDGLGTNGVMILADHPWSNEVKEGRPIAGAAGWYLDNIFRRLGVQRNAFIISHAMWCKPPKFGWADRPDQHPDAALALSHCAPYLDDLIERIKPKCIVALGGAALRRMIGTAKVEEHQCYVEATPYGIPCIGTYHPSFLMRPGNKKLSISLIYALKKSLAIAAGGQARVLDKVLVDPSLEVAESYLNEGLVQGRYSLLVVDIETPRSDPALGVEGEERLYDTGQGLPRSFTILRVGLSHAKNSALSVPWIPPYIDLVRRAIRKADLFVEHAHNHYDYRRLKANGCTFTGRIASSMWLWHWYQSDLDKALEFCAPFFFNGPSWKHLSEMEPGLYNALDVCRTFDVWEGCREAVKGQGRWEAFWQHCVDVDDIMSEIGRIRIDEHAKDVFMSRLRDEAQSKEKELLSNAPVGSTKLLTRTKAPWPDQHPELWTEGVRVKHLKKGPKEYPIWTRQVLNVSSSLQIKGLIEALGMKVPTKGDDGESKETTGAKQLKRLAKKAPLLHTVLQIRSRRKMVEAYDWKADPDGYVRTFYGFNPSTWRTSSYHYNLQVIPSRADLADEFRASLVASKGCLLGEVDSSGIEAVLVGYFAGSDRYIRLAKAGVHGWLVSAYLGQPIPLDAPDLAERCKEFKKSHKQLYNTCKPIIHGSNYMEAPYGIYEQNPDSFASEKEARELQELYFSTEPGKDVRRWQQQTLMIASKQRYLQNPFGYRHEFWDVFRKDHNGETVPSEDAKRAIAFLPQSTASACQRHYLRQLSPAALKMVRLITHDSITIEYPEEQGTLPVEQVAWVMSQPIPQLGGLAIGAEAKIGRNLRDMKGVV